MDYPQTRLLGVNPKHIKPCYMYLALINNIYIERNKIIWKLNMSLNIKIFMWYLLQGVV